MYDACYGSLTQDPAWLSPTSHQTPTDWTNPASAYDGNTGTSSTYTIPGAGTWSPYLTLLRDSVINYDKVRIWSTRQNTAVSQIQVDVHYNGNFVDMYDGSLSVGAYVEYNIGSTQSVDAPHVRYYTTTANGWAGCNEAQFWGQLPDKSAPQIRLAVSWDDGSSWSGTNTQALTNGKTTYWFDVTSEISWTATKLNNTSFRVKAWAQTVSGTVDARLNWLPVEAVYQE